MRQKTVKSSTDKNRKVAKLMQQMFQEESKRCHLKKNYLKINKMILSRNKHEKTVKI